MERTNWDSTAPLQRRSGVLNEPRGSDVAIRVAGAAAWLSWRSSAKVESLELQLQTLASSSGQRQLTSLLLPAHLVNHSPLTQGLPHPALDCRLLSVGLGSIWARLAAGTFHNVVPHNSCPLHPAIPFNNHYRQQPFCAKQQCLQSPTEHFRTLIQSTHPSISCSSEASCDFAHSIPAQRQWDHWWQKFRRRLCQRKGSSNTATCQRRIFNSQCQS
jgi:hypothetical protein